jgi:hypothetical protein
MASLLTSNNPTGATSDSEPPKPEGTSVTGSHASGAESTERDVRQELVDFLKVLQEDGGTDVECRFSHSMCRISYRHGVKDSVSDEEVYKMPRSHAAWSEIKTVFSSQMESGKKYTANVDAVIRALEAGWRKG